MDFDSTLPNAAPSPVSHHSGLLVRPYTVDAGLKLAVRRETPKVVPPATGLRRRFAPVGYVAPEGTYRMFARAWYKLLLRCICVFTDISQYAATKKEKKKRKIPERAVDSKSEVETGVRKRRKKEACKSSNANDDIEMTLASCGSAKDKVLNKQPNKTKKPMQKKTKKTKKNKK